MLVLHFCLMLISILFTHILANTDFFSEPDASLFSLLDDQDLQFNGDLMGGYSLDSPGLPPRLNFKELFMSLNSQDLVPSLNAQDPYPGEGFEGAISSCPEDNDLPSKKVKARNSACPNVPSGPLNLPDLTNLLNSVNTDELPTGEADEGSPASSNSLETFCADSASGPWMIILVCGSVTYADGAGQRPGFFIAVKNSWIGQFFK